MKNKSIILLCIILLISISSVGASDSTREISLGGVKFNVTSNGEFSQDYTCYCTDNFNISLIQEKSTLSLENTVKDKITMGNHDVLIIYLNDFTDAYFSANDKLFKVSCKGKSLTNDAGELIKNSPNSTLTTEQFYAKLGMNPYSDRFNNLDTNHDGKISLDEFEELTEYILEDSFWDGYSPEEAFISEFNNLDLDGDGFLSYEEFSKMF